MTAKSARVFEEFEQAAALRAELASLWQAGALWLALAAGVARVAHPVRAVFRGVSLIDHPEKRPP
ncbi:hypothetical protein [uncultured Maricaulis sp.]|uniref:hypothetical protein n=1 Tax=uncultured Maricaulis sp. TaxID=174710 RepID=UPI0030DCF733|tara:strand:+ start:8985 stop:9179 length:195 start_codon:yes stop_codon:yes gene_type:complete